MAKTTVTTAVMQPTSFDQMARIIEPLARREEEYYTTAIQSHTDLMSLSSALSAEDKNSDFYKGTIAPMLNKLSGYADRIAKEGVISDGAYNRAMMQDLVKLKGQYLQGSTQLKDALTRRAQYNDMASKARLQDPSAVVLGKDMSIQSFIDDPNKIAPLLFSGEDAKRRAFDYLAAWRNSTQDLKLIGNIDRLTRILRTVKGSSAEDVYKAIGQQFSDPKNPLTELYNQVLYQVKSSYGEDIRKHLDEPEANFALVHGVQRGMIGAAGGDAQTPFEDKEAIMMLQHKLAMQRDAIARAHRGGGGHNGGGGGSADENGGSINVIARGGGVAVGSAGVKGRTLLNSIYKSAADKYKRLPSPARTPDNFNAILTESYMKAFGSQNLPEVARILKPTGISWNGNKLVAPSAKSADGKGIDFVPDFNKLASTAEINNRLYALTARNNVAGEFNVSAQTANDILKNAITGVDGAIYGDKSSYAKLGLNELEGQKVDEFISLVRSGYTPKDAKIGITSDGRPYYEAAFFDNQSQTNKRYRVPLADSKNFQVQAGAGSALDFNPSDESLMRLKLYLAKVESVQNLKRGSDEIDEEQVMQGQQAYDIVSQSGVSPAAINLLEQHYGKSKTKGF
jgi:hypothetical protein